MPSIYIVTHGEYSDYGIVAVFSTMEKAEAFWKQHGQENPIEEYEIDAGEDWYKQGYQRWRVCFDKNGNVLDTTSDPEFTKYETFVGRGPIGQHEIHCQVIWIKAKTREDAIKIASEYRLKWLGGQL